MANEEHLKILKQGVEAWNKWREENPDVRPDLRRADLAEANLSKADLQWANLSGADFSGADFSDADLFDTNLSKADLSETDLSGAYLSGADLSGADLSGADLRLANLDRAILRYAGHYVLDECPIDGTRFSPGARDPWSVLRRSYTGPRFFIHLMLLVIFFIPLVLKTTVWTGVSKTESAMNDAVTTLDSLSQLLSDQKPLEIQEVIDSLVTKIHRYVPGRGPEWKKLRVAQLLIGWDKGVWPVILSLVILTYNLLRGFLTFRVSLLREEEERSKYSPAKSEYFWLFRMHQVVITLLAFALFSFGWNAWHWLSQDVWLPT